MRYTQLDRVEVVDPGRSGTGVKLSTRGADSYGYTPYRSAVGYGYPWSLVLEGGFQLAAIVIDPVIGPERRCFLVSVERAHLRGPVPFGVRLDYALSVRGLSRDLARCRCEVRCEDELLGSFSFSMGLTVTRSPALASSMAVYEHYLTRSWRENACLTDDLPYLEELLS